MLWIHSRMLLSYRGVLWSCGVGSAQSSAGRTYRQHVRACTHPKILDSLCFLTYPMASWSQATFWEEQLTLEMHVLIFLLMTWWEFRLSVASLFFRLHFLSEQLCCFSSHFFRWQDFRQAENKTAFDPPNIWTNIIPPHKEKQTKEVPGRTNSISAFLWEFMDGCSDLFSS